MTRYWLKNKIRKHYSGFDFEVLVPPNDNMGDYSTNLVFVLAKNSHRTLEEVGEEVASGLKEDKDLNKIFDKIEFAKPGFINFYLRKEFLQGQLKEINTDQNYGFNETMKDKTIMVEYTDPNPFKLFHVGHLMSNTIGETIARLYEAAGAKVIRVTWQGDVGMHIAMAVWAIKTGKLDAMPTNDISLEDKMSYLGKAYSVGTVAYKEDPYANKEIEELNKNIYSRDNSEVNYIYDTGRKWSLDYFEEIYKRLGSKFDHYFFESELGEKGLEIVKQHPEVFEESEGAVIFRGEKYGLHTRVFINSSGLPVYESKELSLNKEKFDRYNPDLSVIITGNEINAYFKVLLKVMELTMPEVAKRTRHISHGMLRLPGGKMSSRTGDVITADSLIEQIKTRLPEARLQENLEAGLQEETREKIAIGAIKYSILKQGPGYDIVFDFEKSLSVKGDSGPYLQYTYARLNNIVTKAGRSVYNLQFTTHNLLNHEIELKLLKHLLKLPDVVEESCEEIAPQHLALYLYELSNTANHFYETVRVLEDENTERRNSRLLLVKTVAAALKRGLNLLGIDVLSRI